MKITDIVPGSILKVQRSTGSGGHQRPNEHDINVCTVIDIAVKNSISYDEKIVSFMLRTFNSTIQSIETFEVSFLADDRHDEDMDTFICETSDYIYDWIIEIIQ